LETGGAGVLEKVFERLTAFRGECFACEVEGFDAIEAEGAKAVAGFAPCRKRPNTRPEGEREGTYAAVSCLSGWVRQAGVAELQNASV
jgi:hypothetical protein